MPGATPRFWATPLKYCRWAARERPSLFWSCVIAGFGPLHLIVVPPVRRALGDYDAPQIPMTYPVPTTPRKKLTGYGDETE
ncbi:n19m, NADH-ubiquinone oxidoreductase 9.5 kDa subunit [Podospora pseudocomata]|uniref:N19m, NADH-ubiquinone oxidoreductase 9.5 kDa subunit n=1 Tax=Podospora pseudocomata TaxID=2093779 RepID=A0ABR0GW08_9PEZI|nr:n19m, NADH-ubiquinone oxidoreductase 9.5 kDa subunit [Podospora pseudocomata]